jgi:hypothetical protein
VLPSPVGVSRPVVVLRLRGRPRVGATLIDVLADYAGELAETGGRLYLAGVSDPVAAQLQRSGKLDIGGAVVLVPARPVLGESVSEALALANDWLRGAGERPVEERVRSRALNACQPRDGRGSRHPQPGPCAPDVSHARASATAARVDSKTNAVAWWARTAPRNLSERTIC